jgi:hypothetical protein
MADLGDVIGALMAGIIRARRIADEQTAALAEYYRGNPLLQGLSVPRIRIPELKIEMPVIVEGQTAEQASKMADAAVLASAAYAQIKETLARRKLVMPPNFSRSFSPDAKAELMALMKSTAPATREAVVRCLQEISSSSLQKANPKLSAADLDAVAKDLRKKILAAALVKEPVGAQILANVRTADVKEQTSTTNVVRITITLKEEGLEWATQASESGGVISTLQAE